VPQSPSDLERALQAIPAVDQLLAAPAFKALAAQWRRESLRRFVTLRLTDYRNALREGKQVPLTRAAILGRLPAVWAAEWKALCEQGTQRVINGTGVLLHTNLGRAPLSATAQRDVALAARWPVDLELDLASGERASRTRKVELLLVLLTGAEAAYAVNNNAAALTLAVDSLARERRLIVSRGEQVEIGGSFRLPEILERFAGRMAEVGTTNRTRIADYAAAIGRRGDVLLKVHRSNFTVTGYVEEASLAELVELGKARGCPVIYDLGSGRFDAGAEWLGEPPLGAALAAGPDLISFSADKVFGGPQAGILLGSAEMLAKLRANPLARALRLDKLNVAALQATLSDRLALDCPLPTTAMLRREREEIETLAGELAAGLTTPPLSGLEVEVQASAARSGGGAAAESDWPSAGLALRVAGVPASRLARLLRSAKPALVGTLRHDEFFLDLAAVSREELPDALRALRRVLARAAKEGAGS
jgi:L-seryl-tRNA(Ser) seleniumtransferase